MKIGISSKIIGLFIGGTALFAASIWISYFTMSDLLKTLKDIEKMSERVELSGELQLHISKLALPVAEYVSFGEESERDHYDRRISDILDILNRLKGYEGDQRWQKVLEVIGNDLTKLGSMTVELLYMENPASKKEAQKLIRDIYAYSEQIIENAGNFHQIAREKMKEIEGLAKDKRRRAYNTFATLLVIAVVLIPLLSFYTLRYIRAPILKLYEGAAKIGEGVLNHRITVKTGDELETLANGFNRMAASLEEAREELDRRVLELYTLYNVSKIMNTSFETEQLLIRLVNDIGKNLKINRVIIMLLDEGRQELYSASHTGFSKESLNGFRRRVGEGFYGLVATTGMARLIRDVDTELNLPADDIISPDIRSMIAVPFGRHDKILGLLCAFKDRPDTFEWDDLELLRAVAEHVAIALENTRLYQETKLLAITDGLTGLYNHRFFRERLKVEMERTERYSHNLSLIILDIDHFKNYNDAHGHPAGDLVLKELAELLRKGIRGSDLACRYGGEEFAIILPECTREAAMMIAERIRKDISLHPFPHRETQPLGAVTASIGIATYPVDEKEMDILIRKADEALYIAKHAGRNRVIPAQVISGGPHPSPL